MKLSSIFMTCAAAFIVFAAGCGGGGGDSSGLARATANVQGVWSGTATPSAGSQYPLNLDFTQNGTTLSGSSQVELSPVFYTGTVTGSTTGSNATVNVVSPTYGTTVVNLTITGNTATGTYARTIPTALGGGTETGTITIGKQMGVSTATLNSTYGGSIVNNRPGSTPQPISINVIQNGDSFTFSGVLNNSTAITGTGTIIGNTVTFTSTQQATGIVTYFAGTIGTNSIKGSTYQPGTDPGNNGAPVYGTFTLVTIVPL